MNNFQKRDKFFNKDKIIKSIYFYLPYFPLIGLLYVISLIMHGNDQPNKVCIFESTKHLLFSSILQGFGSGAVLICLIKILN